MNDDQTYLQRDLEILDQMALEMEEYLTSESIKWTMARGDMPPLTIGGCLMRQKRMAILRDQLSLEEKARLSAAYDRIEQLLADKVVRFEARAHQEIHARKSEWIGHLRNWSDLPEVQAGDYAHRADTRVVLTALMDRLETRPYHLDPKVVTELDAVDQYLRGCWIAGEFIWPAVWKQAYPQELYWWLYGTPKCTAASRELFKMDAPIFASPTRARSSRPGA